MTHDINKLYRVLTRYAHFVNKDGDDMKRANGDGSIYKDNRAGGYIAAVVVGYDPQSGKMIRRTKHAKTLQDAKKHLDNLKRNYSIGIAADVLKKPLYDVIEGYVYAYIQPAVQPQTMQNYEYLLHTASQIKELQIPVEYITKLAISQGLNTIKAVTYRNKLLALVKATLNSLEDEGAIQRNPARGLKPTPKRPREKNLISPEEFHEMEKNAKELPSYIKIALLLLFYTGMRAGEALALTWDKIDKDKGIVKINKTASTVKGKAVLCDTKTIASRRAVALPQNALSQLMEYKVEQSKEILSQKNYKRQGFLITDNGELRSAKWLLEKMHPILNGHTLHEFRHSHASLLLSRNINPKDVQKRLGHTSALTTMNIYAHAINDETAIKNTLRTV